MGNDEGAAVVGLGQIALNSAPVLGGVMLALAAGQFRGPDFRTLIKQDMDLLDRLPPEATGRRAEMRRMIDARIDDMIADADRTRALRKAACPTRGIGATWCSWSAWCCSPSSGGTSTTAAAIGCRRSSC
jgi:hypothetical protein